MSANASPTLRLLSGGAAQGLVRALQPQLHQDRGATLEGSFGAVGVMRERLLAGEPCDLIILTRALIGQLEQEGHVVPGSAVDLGAVRTGIAVRSGQPHPDISDREALRRAFMAAPGIYAPDPQKATAGIHFMKVLKALGIDGTLASRLRLLPNGATAMAELAKGVAPGLIGCTQVTEILYTPGVELAGFLPKEFELATVYTAAVCTKASDPALTREFIAMLAGPQAAALRAQGGFEAA